jgi:hypothetical protein
MTSSGVPGRIATQATDFAMDFAEAKSSPCRRTLFVPNFLYLRSSAAGNRLYF